MTSVVSLECEFEMDELKDKPVLVVGLGARAARAGLRTFARGAGGARCFAADAADTEDLRAATAGLRALGVEVELGVTNAPDQTIQAWRSSAPAVPGKRAPSSAKSCGAMSLSSENLSLAAGKSQCLNITVAGTNGKKYHR